MMDESSKKLVSDLEEAFNKGDEYNYIEYLRDNKGLFISAISVISAVMLFLARIISYIVVNTRYQYWNLDESFLVEDSKVYLKLGIYFLYLIFSIFIISVAKRYVYRWKLYDCKVFLYGKIFEEREKKVKLKRKAIQELKRWVTDIVNSNEPIDEDRLELVNSNIKELELENKELIKECLDDRFEVFKIRVGLFIRLIPTFIVIVVASLFLQYVSGIDIENNGTKGLLQSAFFSALVIMIAAIFNAFLEIKLTLLVIIKRFFKDDKVDWSSEYTEPVIKWLDSKISEQNNQRLKASFSDKSIRLTLGNILFSALALAIFLKWNVAYSLEHTNSFYVFNDDKQDYVMLVNDGSKYVFSECMIDDGKLIIDTNSIIVRNNPVKLKKEYFEIVERK